MDEVDALLSARSDSSFGRGAAHNVVLNEFMQEMDGLTSDEGRVIVIGATNRPFDLDDAILRRLPRRMLVDLPDAAGREGECGERARCHGAGLTRSNTEYPVAR
jgi:SpoVK/Ycf46/Vps4 family AAA+-type ATPase